MGIGKGIFNQLMIWVGPIDQFGQIDQGALQNSYHSPEREGASGDVRKVWDRGQGVRPMLEEKVFTLNIWIFNTKNY